MSYTHAPYFIIGAMSLSDERVYDLSLNAALSSYENTVIKYFNDLKFILLPIKYTKETCCKLVSLSLTNILWK